MLDSFSISTPKCFCKRGFDIVDAQAIRARDNKFSHPGSPLEKNKGRSCPSRPANAGVQSRIGVRSECSLGICRMPEYIGRKYREMIDIFFGRI